MRARRLDQHHFAVENDATTPDAVFISERANIEDALAASDLPPNYPIQRACVDELLAALWHHSRRVNMLGLLPAALHFFQLLPDPVFEIGD
jgi:hypothetical protein